MAVCDPGIDGRGCTALHLRQGSDTSVATRERITSAEGAQYCILGVCWASFIRFLHCYSPPRVHDLAPSIGISRILPSSSPGTACRGCIIFHLRRRLDRLWRSKTPVLLVEGAHYCALGGNWARIACTRLSILRRGCTVLHLGRGWVLNRCLWRHLREDNPLRGCVILCLRRGIGEFCSSSVVASLAESAQTCALGTS